MLTQELLNSPNLPDVSILSLGEPDDLAIITDSYLEGLLNTNHHQRHHRASSNPEAAKDDADADAARYLTHVAAWRKRSTEIRKIVAAGVGDQGQERGQIVLINRYVLSRADAAASRLSADGLSPVEHWQWCASLFRSCVGSDLVVYVQEMEDGDPSPDVVSPTREIEGARVLFVTWRPGGSREWCRKVIGKLVYDIEVMARIFRGRK